MDTSNIHDDAVNLVSDFDAAIDRAESWLEKILTGGIESRVLGSFAGETISAMKALKSDVDAIAKRLEPTAPEAESKPPATA
jgi:hypothetical protein